MSRRTSATAILAVSIVACLVADIAAARDSMPENHRVEWGWFGGIVFVVWAWTMWKDER